MSAIINMFEKNKIFIYYLILLLIVLFRTSLAEPNAVIRYGFLIAFFAPLALNYKYLFPPCLIAFMTIGTYGYAYNFFPYDMSMYVVIATMGLFMGVQNRYYKPGADMVFIITYFSLSCIYNSFSFNNFIFCFITIVIMIYYLGRGQYNLQLMLNCFCIASLSLALIYLLNYEKFLTDYRTADGMSRSGWTDPNYLSCIIGMGVVTAFYQLLTVKQKTLVQKAFWLSTIGITFIAQVLMASRGGLLSVSVSCVILIFMSDIKLSNKLVFVLVIMLFIGWLYQNNYFELLEYRIQHDSGTGSGRTEIWNRKYMDFSNENFFNILFGVGYERSLSLGGYIKGIAFHNDFMAILCQYGLIGLMLFIYMLIRPFYNLNKRGRVIIFSMVAYIVSTCMTLDPFSSGRLTYFGFYLLILLLANSFRMKSTNIL